MQDDVRQYLFWMYKWANPDLFQNDWIANYFQSVAPLGYRAFYHAFNHVGISPLLLSKLIPTLLGWLTTFYCFQLCQIIIPIPLAGFITSTLLNQQLWLDDGLVSATPRAFLYPIFLAILYFIQRQSIWQCGIAIALLGIFYPQCILVCFGVLSFRLIQFSHGSFRIVDNLRERKLALVGISIATIIIFYYVLSIDYFSPVISAQDAKTLSEFGGAGNSAFFYGGFWNFWIWGQRSGLLPEDLLKPIFLIPGLCLPYLILYPTRFPLVRQAKPGVTLIFQVLSASLLLFFLAHCLLFKLHLPSRYTHHSLRICLALAAGISSCSLLDQFFQWLTGSYALKFNTAFLTPLEYGIEKRYRVELKVMIIGILTLGILINPLFWKGFPKAKYITGRSPELYQFFDRQPENSLIASISREADNIPSFSKRSVWFAWEYAVPYHWGYYRQIQQRAIQLIQAQYSPEIKPLQDLVRTQKINFIVLDTNAFQSDYILKNSWLRQWYHSLGKEILSMYEQPRSPAIMDWIEQCAVLRTEKQVVLESSCLLNPVK
ncbi:MAG: hypothetical protein HC835_21555 [Oscillatoriales cyanobacterium RM2_1_1]|nr:hypothetical protein [Oscillatoriales cyanobacterium SM2_3_0]NJO47972.1 hypothetical protein [Oscillatoriales cyanobacterium RM2_1_1]